MVAAMDQKAAIDDIVARADALRKPLYVLCREAGLSPSTFYRWRNGARAGFDNLIALRQRLAELENDRAA